jgi:hypothetical protein
MNLGYERSWRNVREGTGPAIRPGPNLFDELEPALSSVEIETDLRRLNRSAAFR